MVDYFRASHWATGPSIGGVWDVELKKLIHYIGNQGPAIYNVQDSQLREKLKYDDGDFSLDGSANWMAIVSTTSLPSKVPFPRRIVSARALRPNR